MKLTVEAPEGALALRPGDALSALADVAEADGADRGDWLEKALAANGATSIEDRVSQNSRYPAVNEFTLHAARVYERSMDGALARIAEVLERAAQTAATDQYKRLE